MFKAESRFSLNWRKFLGVTLLFLSCCLGRSEAFKVVGPKAPLFVEAGEDLVLPCSIQPNTSAVDMRVEWFRTDKADALVHLYKDHEDRDEGLSESYRGRTALFREELPKGNASLKLSVVRVSDEGSYKCLVEAQTWYNDINIDVIVEALGTLPLITVEGFDNKGGISLICESRGWNPEPEVVWLDSKGVTLSAEDTETHRDIEGFSVKQRITVYDTNKFFCRLQQKHHMRQAEIIISGTVFYTWKVLIFSLSVLSVPAAIGLILAFMLCVACRNDKII